MNTKPAQRLPDAVKAAVVCALACYDSPAAVVALIKAEYSLQLSPQLVECYDPSKRAGRALSAKWRALFEATRAEFVNEISTIGIAHKAVRLRTLDRMANKAEERGNLALCAQLLEQAAKECGDAYTNYRKIDASVSTLPEDLEDLTDAELVAIINAGRATGKIQEVIIRGGLPD